MWVFIWWRHVSVPSLVKWSIDLTWVDGSEPVVRKEGSEQAAGSPTVRQASCRALAGPWLTGWLAGCLHKGSRLCSILAGCECPTVMKEEIHFSLIINTETDLQYPVLTDWFDRGLNKMFVCSSSAVQMFWEWKTKPSSRLSTTNNSTFNNPWQCVLSCTACASHWQSKKALIRIEVETCLCVLPHMQHKDELRSKRVSWGLSNYRINPLHI